MDSKVSKSSFGVGRPNLNFNVNLNEAKDAYIGVFDGYSVTVSDHDDIRDIYNLGCFGKSSHTRSAPLRKHRGEIIFAQQLENRRKWSYLKHSGSELCKAEETRRSLRSFFETCSSVDMSGADHWKKWKAENEENVENKVKDKINPGNPGLLGWTAKENDAIQPTDILHNLVANIVESGSIMEMKQCSSALVIFGVDTASGWTEVVPKMVSNVPEDIEILSLSLEEAFYLSFKLKTLIIKDTKGKVIESQAFWRICQDAEQNFVAKYCCYQHYRLKGWVVRPGLKYGGEYLLYNESGPGTQHSEYLVRMVGKGAVRWNTMLAWNRLVETVNKVLIVCQILGLEKVTGESLDTPDILDQLTVVEVRQPRWHASGERDKK